MKRILVAIKRVVDYNVRIRVRPDGSGVVTDGVKFSINPFDEIALEEALRIRERGQADEVVVTAIGPAAVEPQLRAALAFGADRAIHIVEDQTPDSLCVAELLLRLIEREAPQLALLGKQAIDDDNGQTAQMLAALWQRPQATYISSLELEDGSATVARETDSGIETLSVELPGVFSADLRLNEPRFVKLPDILKAKKKTIEQLTAGELGVEVVQRVNVVRVTAPPERAPGIRVDNVDELIDSLLSRDLL